MADEDLPMLSAVFHDHDSYSTATGLFTREICRLGRTEKIAVNAPIARDVLRDIVQSALESDLFSIDTTPKPIPWKKLTREQKKRFKSEGVTPLSIVPVITPCWRSWLEISVGDKKHRIDWDCQSSHVEGRREIKRLERALAPFKKNLQPSDCLAY